MPGELVFGVDAVTPATSLADGQTVRRSGGNLVGTDVLHTVVGFTVLQTELRTGVAAGAAISIGTLTASAGISLTAPTDNNAGQHPFSVGQGTKTRLSITGSSGGTEAFLAIGSSTDVCNLILHGTITITRPDLAATLITSQGVGAGIQLAGSGDKLGFFGQGPIAQPTLSTGALHTPDDIITVLQNLGLVKQ